MVIKDRMFVSENLVISFSSFKHRQKQLVGKQTSETRK
jgi:hypothetical protein